MSDAIDMQEERLKRDLEGTADWLEIRWAAIDGLRVRIAQAEEWARRDREAVRVLSALSHEANVLKYRRALRLAEAWQPMLEIPRRR